jgi:LPXTG-motif cell wall-anchored protein
MRKLAFLFAALLLAGSATVAYAQVTVLVTLLPRPGQTATGTATLRPGPAPNQTIVTVTVRGLPPNQVRVNHIHRGSCEAEGPIVYPLTDLRSDAQGNATASTTVPASLATLTTGQYYINVHAGPALPAPGISCGNIMAARVGPAQAPAQAPRALPRTGSMLPAVPVVGAGAVALATLLYALRRRRHA